jgi:hypothetical protein
MTEDLRQVMDAIAAAGAEIMLDGGTFPIDSVECRKIPGEARCSEP